MADHDFVPCDRLMQKPYSVQQQWRKLLRLRGNLVAYTQNEISLQLRYQGLSSSLLLPTRKGNRKRKDTGYEVDLKKQLYWTFVPVN